MNQGLFTRLGAFAVRRRWYVITAWIVTAVVMAAFSRGLQARLGQGGFEVPGSDSLAVQHLIEQFPGQFPGTALVVVHNPNATPSDATFRATVAGIASRVRPIDGVGGVQWQNDPVFVSADGHTSYVLVGLTGNQNQNLVTASKIQSAVQQHIPAGYQVETGGSYAYYNRFDDISKADLSKAEEISFPITLIVLLVAFTTMVAAGLPIMLALLSLIITLGTIYFLAGVTNMSVYVTNTASAIGIGVGIDYALFVVTRYREELGRGRSVADAVAVSVGTSGRAVALSGATVIVALAGMFIVNVQAFRSMAIGCMTVVAVAVVGALTLMPAVLSLIGLRIDRLRVPFLGRNRRPDGEGFWHRWALSIMRRPWAYLIASLAILLTLAAPLLTIQLGQSGSAILPPGEAPRVASEQMARAFGPGVAGPLEVLVPTSGPGAPSDSTGVTRLIGELRADPGVAAVTGPVQAPGLSRITVIAKFPPESKDAEALVQRVRGTYVPAAGLSGSALVGGETAFNLDLENEIAGHLPEVIGVVLALSFILLMMAFRSLLLPLKAIIMNLLSVGAAYGLMVALFQWGWAESLLGFRSQGFIDVWVPMFLFSILFGLSMDYEVFLMSRIREEYGRTGSNEQAVAQGLESSARTITSAALIMVTVFAAFATSRLVPFKEMGFGLASAVFIDATIVRTVLVPSAMKLMGDWNWWMPAWLDRWLPRIALETDHEPVAPAPELETV